jgi:hypothetical protein
MPPAYLRSFTPQGAQMCAKILYPTRHEARRVIGKTTTSHTRPIAHGLNGTLKAYFCHNCQGFHVGHEMPKPRRELSL